MLCIFRILTAYRYIVYKYFLHSIDGLFISMLLSFTMQRFLVWCSSICLFLLLFPLPEETYPKIFQRPMTKRVLPIFPSRVFFVSGLISNSWIHFEFIFLLCIRKYSKLIVSHVYAQVFQHHLLKSLSSPHCIFLPPLSQINWLYKCGFSSVPLSYMFVSVPVPYYFNQCSFVL